jgi:methylamine utilization protein MauE
MDNVSLPAFALFVTLIVAVVGKLTNLDRFGRSIERRLGSESRAAATALGVVIGEVITAVAILTPGRELAAMALLVFLPAAAAWLIGARSSPHKVVLEDCGCFGPTLAWASERQFDVSALKPAWWSLRNGVLAGLAIQLVIPDVSAATAFGGGIALVASAGLAAISRAIADGRRLISVRA